MALKAIEVLRKGLEILKKQVKVKKEALQAQLAEKKPISSEDEQWLDHDANLVDEERVLEAVALRESGKLQQTYSPAASYTLAVVKVMYVTDRAPSRRSPPPVTCPCGFRPWEPCRR